MTEGRPLQPLSYGNVLIVGVKSSNLDEEIKTNPRVIIWDSQQQHWTNKEVPDNIRAIFMTRFVSHNTSEMLLRQARKRQLTIFNPEGTGQIARQVKELLNMIPLPTNDGAELKETIVTDKPKYIVNKLKPLHPFMDFSKSNTENGRALLIKAKELGIETTEMSLTQLVSVHRRKSGLKYYESSKKVVHKKATGVDVSVDILDGIIKELTDMREFLIATTDENLKLKSKVDKFRKFFED